MLTHRLQILRILSLLDQQTARIHAFLELARDEFEQRMAFDALAEISVCEVHARAALQTARE